MIVRYARQAAADLNAARDYIALDNPRAAAEVAKRLREAIDGLRQFPERGRTGRVASARELVIPGTPFVVPYRVIGREIQVLAVLHGARAWPPGDGS
ncbi:type II toxin-antitoxin system RelE/ParE family toxin [Sabulicella rubraurantiaca]|uniref:type II toxin-antitoxin system RelE/ParE family toxin n=1 Tax=Sabulicella rubraurantiaca TaxID=2811429 RepID=UPI001A9630EC